MKNDAEKAAEVAAQQLETSREDLFKKSQDLLITATVVSREDLQARLDRYAALDVKEVEDMVAYNALKDGLKELKSYRVNIQKTRKQITAPFTEFRKDMIAVENQLVGLITPIEESLEKKKKAVDDKKEAMAQELFETRSKKLLENGFVQVNKHYVAGVIQVSAQELALISEGEFFNYLNHGIEELERQKKEKELRDAELKRIEEAKAAAEAAKKAAEEQNAELRAQLDALKKQYGHADKEATEEPTPAQNEPPTTAGVDIPKEEPGMEQPVAEEPTDAIRPNNDFEQAPTTEAEEIVPQKVDVAADEVAAIFKRGFVECQKICIKIIEDPKAHGLEKLTKNGLIETIDALEPSDLF
jgi:hypothetical protein